MSDHDPTSTELMRRGWQARRESMRLSAPAMQARLFDAREHLKRATRISEENTEFANLAQSHHMLAHVEKDLGNLEEALKHWDASVRILRTLDEPFELAHKVRHLADALVALGRREEAEPHLRESLSLYRSHPAPPTLDLANAVTRMAALDEHFERRDDAILHWKEGRHLYAQCGLDEGIAHCERALSRLTRS